VTDTRDVLLALRALKLGDLLVAVPALTALRRGFPEHRIVLAAPEWLRPVVGLIPAIDELLPTPGLDDPLAWSGPVDVAVNLHGRGPESRLLLEALAPRRRIGHAGPGWEGPDWLDGINERVRWARLVSAHGLPAHPDDVGLAAPPVASPRPGAAVLHVGAFYGARHWPLERFAAVAYELRAAGLEVVITAGPAEGDRAAETARLAAVRDDGVFAGETALDLTGLAALIAGASVMISADTGAAHLASAYATPSVVIFGPAPIAEWGPPAGPHVALSDERVRRGDVFSAEPDPALLAVSAGEVAETALGLLRRRPPARSAASATARSADA
jgi:ADP-heptose:LPS heptosyltransferase